MKPSVRIIRRAVLVSVLVALTVLAYRFFPRILEPGPTGIVASGTVEATEAQLGFQNAGRIESIVVREGSAVTVGQSLAQIDFTEMQARREQVLAQETAARAALRELESGFRSEEVAQALAALAAATERRDDARRDLERTRRLVEGGAIGAESQDKAGMAFDVATSQQEQAQQQLKLLQAGPRKEKVDAQRAQVAQAAAAVKLIDATLANMVIRAPFAGIVTQRHREPGETVAPGAPVLTLMNPHDRWVRIYVPERRLGQVQLGSKAAITIDSFPDKNYSGEVVYIASEAEFTPKSVQTTEERVKLVYAVKVKVVGDENLELKPGLPADVRLDQGLP